jgi:hypothetical protein
MNSQPTRSRAWRICARAAVIGLLVTGIVPVLFFRFPGPKFIPLRYEWMWAITELLWKPLRLLQIGLGPLVNVDLRQRVNPYFVAPILNALVAFVVAWIFLRLGDRRRRRSPKPDGGPELESAVEHVEAIRRDYPVALRTLPHPTAHAEAVMEEARAKVGGHPYFQPQIEPEASQEDDQHE